MKTKITRVDVLAGDCANQTDYDEIIVFLSGSLVRSLGVDDRSIGNHQHRLRDVSQHAQHLVDYRYNAFLQFRLGHVTLVLSHDYSSLSILSSVRRNSRPCRTCCTVDSGVDSFQQNSVPRNVTVARKIFRIFLHHLTNDQIPLVITRHRRVVLEIRWLILIIWGLLYPRVKTEITPFHGTPCSWSSKTLSQYEE